MQTHYLGSYGVEMTKQNTMRNVFFGGAVLVAAFISGSQASAIDALPAGYGDLVPEADFGPAMSTLVKIGTTSCVVKSSNVSGLPVQTKLDLPPADLMQFAGILADIKTKSASLVALDCTPTILFSATEKTITGTVANKGLGLTGSFSLKCSFKQSVTINASLSFGMAVAGGARMSIDPTTSTIPISCGIRIVMSDATTMNGTVEGSAVIGAAAPCEGAVENSCVGIVADTKVTVTSGTGELKGYVGSGTYTFQDSFTLPEINDSLGQVGSALGKSSVSAFRLAPRVAGSAGTMNISFVPGAPKTEILYPAVVAGAKSAFGKNATYAAVSSPKAKCVFTAVKGAKQFALPAVIANAQGATTTKKLTATQATKMSKALGIKAGSAFVLRAKCGSATTNQNVVYSIS